MNISKEIQLKADRLFDKMPNVKVLFLNTKGEFFTNEALCKMSVKSEKDFTTVTRGASVEKTTKVETTGSKADFSELKKLSKEELVVKLKPEGRTKLNAIASALGVEKVEELDNKASVIDSIVGKLHPSGEE